MCRLDFQIFSLFILRGVMKIIFMNSPHPHLQQRSSCPGPMMKKKMEDEMLMMINNKHKVISYPFSRTYYNKQGIQKFVVSFYPLSRVCIDLSEGNPLIWVLYNWKTSEKFIFFNVIILERNILAMELIKFFLKKQQMKKLKPGKFP